MEELVKTKRRDFLKQTLSLSVFGMLANSPMRVLAKALPKKLTILHTNDWHSRIEPFPAIDKNYGGMGGAEVRAAVIKNIREKEGEILLLDAGDIFQGTPYFNFYGGELEFKLMTEMGYDCATLGNHDFDNGLDGFNKQLPHAGFSFVNANYDFSKTLLKDKILPYKIFKKKGLKIGVFGIGIELKGLVPDKLFGNTIYNDPVMIANQIALILKRDKKCDLVICLSHLGYKYNSSKVSDEVLASQTQNIDLIIGGHTHTFLPEPVIFKNLVNKNVIVNQVGWAGLQLGRIDFTFEPFINKNYSAQSSLIKFTNGEDAYMLMEG
ncbi:MAG: metallophosphatase [Bacteroidia bacterium]|nr:metallophosphatase [Bacteroidia bacterium]